MEILSSLWVKIRTDKSTRLLVEMNDHNLAKTSRNFKFLQNSPVFSYLWTVYVRTVSKGVKIKV